MSCPGLHCAACSGGAAVPAVPLIAFCGLAWVAEHLVDVAIICGASGVLAVAAVVVLMRWADRRDAQRRDLWVSRQPEILSATVITQVKAKTPQAITHHHGPVFNFYGPDAEATAARILYQALPGQAGNAIIERN